MEIVLFFAAIALAIAFALSNFGPTYHFKNDWKKPRRRGSAAEREAEEDRRIREIVRTELLSKTDHPKKRGRRARIK